MCAPARLLRAWEVFAKEMELEYRCSDDCPYIDGTYRGVPVSFRWDEEVHVGSRGLRQAVKIGATGRPHAQINLTVDPDADPKRTRYWHRRTGDVAFDAAFLITCHATGFAERVLTERIRKWMLALGNVCIHSMSRAVSISVLGTESEPPDESDPDRLRAMLELAVEVAIVGSAAYLGG